MLATHILLAILASVATAFRIPEGTQDGFYKAYINELGEEVHERATAATMERANAFELAAMEAMIKRSSVTTSRVAARITDFWELSCGCGYNMVWTSSLVIVKHAPKPHLLPPST